MGCTLKNVHIAETATDKVPNSSPTAASASSDLYGSATADACRQLNERLAPFKERMPRASFAEIAKAAYLERVDLSAHGFYATPDITGLLLISVAHAPADSASAICTWQLSASSISCCRVASCVAHAPGNESDLAVALQQAPAQSSTVFHQLLLPGHACRNLKCQWA